MVPARVTESKVLEGALATRVRASCHWHCEEVCCHDAADTADAGGEGNVDESEHGVGGEVDDEIEE
eukprot:6467569-Amphidinium_carterae.1